MSFPDCPLVQETPAGWAAGALPDQTALNHFLLDHAGCERKAAANCLAFITRYSEHSALVEPLATLAREELEHFAAVHRILLKRGLTLVTDEKDFYVNAMIAEARKAPRERLLDRLMIAGLIEARGHERFLLAADQLAHALGELDLATFYRTLARAEAGHFRVFIRIAERIYPAHDVVESLARMAEVESRAMLAAPLRPSLH